MSKFIQIIEQHSKFLAEQDVPPPPESGSSPADTLPPEEETNTNPDVPAGIATMGNLLKKALTMNISDDDRYKISQLPEINEKNADEIINKLLTIMKTYSADIDIDSNPNTSI
jgi:hypothetical protein